MQLLLILNTIIFGVFFAIWSNKGWFNWFLKMTIFFMFVFNGLYLLQALGYVVKG